MRTVADQRNVVGPLAQEDGEVFAAGAGGEDGEPLVAVLEAVAVRAGVRGGSPDVGEARDVRHLVEHAVARSTVRVSFAPNDEVTRTVPSSASAAWTSAVTTS